MEICFIDKDYREFLKEHCPDIDERIGAGWFVDSKGLKLGQHKGFAYYTIGQRKGLEIALGKPAYVLKINPAKNTVMLGDADQLKAEYMLVEQVNVKATTEEGLGFTGSGEGISSQAICMLTSPYNLVAEDVENKCAGCRGCSRA